MMKPKEKEEESVDDEDQNSEGMEEINEKSEDGNEK